MCIHVLVNVCIQVGEANKRYLPSSHHALEDLRVSEVLSRGTCLQHSRPLQTTLGRAIHAWLVIIELPDCG